jgi:hypothetical protein
VRRVPDRLGGDEHGTAGGADSGHAARASVDGLAAGVLVQKPCRDQGTVRAFGQCGQAMQDRSIPFVQERLDQEQATIRDVEQLFDVG